MGWISSTAVSQLLCARMRPAVSFFSKWAAVAKGQSRIAFAVCITWPDSLLAAMQKRKNRGDVYGMRLIEVGREHSYSDPSAAHHLILLVLASEVGLCPDSIMEERPKSTEIAGYCGGVKREI